MATMSRAEPKHMYSWWWASHMSPKNSKWLQENLTDMDSKVKLMIKLIEVDEDSFARRAEMYYKKRPELMKLVEEFYRAYRALAERYDHATGLIRHAHKTMAEAFPNQVPILESVDGSFGPSNGSDPHKPEMSDLVQAFWTPGKLEKGDAGLTPPYFHSVDRNGPFWSREASFAKIAEGRVRKALNFHDAKIKVQTQKAHGLSESDRLERSDTDIMTLKEALAKLEDEKEAGLLQYQQTVQRLSNLESEVLRAQGDSKGFHERASKAKAEVWSLKESLAKLEGDREASLFQYQQCLNRIFTLESYVSCVQEDAEKQVCEAEAARVLKEELAQLKNEKEAGLAKYMEALEHIANMENTLLLAEDKASLASERADHAEKEVSTLKEALAIITEEKEAAAFQYQQCLEKIASLENEFALSHEEAGRLKDEMDQGTAKLKDAEEQCQLLERSNKTMKTELDSVLFKLGIQNEELSEKQVEVGRLWSCIQEERVRVVESETAFRTLQDLHSQTQEELRSGAAELQKRVQLLKDMEIQNQNLQSKAQKIRDENKSLNELNTSSAVSIKNMDGEILKLKEGKEKLKEELELQLDQRNSLQQELYCLKEELDDLNEKHQAMLEQVESVGFEPEYFVSSVTDLKEENSKLKETCQRNEAEISVLLKKLDVMEKLIEKNAVLEHSLSELSVELEDAREKVKALEESYQLLMNEKSIVLGDKATLISQLDITAENLDKLSERNAFLEHSLFDANAKFEALRAKSRNLEDSCKLLNDEKSVLVNERHAIDLKLETSHQRLRELGEKHADLEKSYNSMEEERVCVLRLVEDLHNSLAAEKQEHDSSTQLRCIQMEEMESKICVLQVLVDQTRGQLGEELDKAANAQFEIFILRNSLQDLRETNCSLLKYCEKLLEASTSSEKLISELEHENTEKKEEVSFLIDQITSLRLGMFQLLKVLQVDLNHVSEDDLDADQMVLHHILVKLDDTRRSLSRAWDENQKLVIEKSVLVTLLGQLKQEVADLKTLIDSLQQEFSKRNDHLSSLQGDMLKLLQSNEKLILRVREGNHKEELLASEMGSLRAKLRKMQGVCEDLEKENSRMLAENRSLSKAVIDLDDEKHNIELENSHLVVETVTQDTLSLIFKNIILERSKATSHLIDDVYKLIGENRVLEDKLRIMDAMLGEYQTENMSFKAALEIYDDEMKQAKATQCQLEHEIANAKDQVSHKEMELLQVVSLNDEHGKEIHELSRRHDQQIKESECLRESMHNLEAEIRRMRVEHRETVTMVESLRSDLKKAKDEAELWEAVAGTTFVELQTSSVCEALYRDKFFELARDYQCLVDRNNSDGLKALQLKERVESLEGENSQMKAQWIGYVPAMETLRDAVASLERHVMRTEADNVHDEDVSSSYRLAEVEERPGDEHRHSIIKQPNQIPDPLELATKDIMLDQASESSSRRNNLNIWYNSTESDDQIVELWEAVDKVGNIQQPEAVNKHNDNELHSSEIPAEKELRVDSLELSKRYTKLNEAESNEKILERLSSDAQKLTNLQITVHDLKQKVVMITDNSNPTKGKDTHYSGVKDQLNEAERAIAKLLDANSKLVNHTKNCSTDTPLWPTSSPISDPLETGEGERRRRKVSEQARRCTEKIGRLQVEVQKIQFLLLKLDSGSIIGRSSGTQIVERDRKVPLRVYFYGAGACSSRRRRTTRFCACLQPPTSGD